MRGMRGEGLRAAPVREAREAFMRLYIRAGGQSGHAPQKKICSYCVILFYTVLVTMTTGDRPSQILGWVGREGRVGWRVGH